MIDTDTLLYTILALQLINYVIFYFFFRREEYSSKYLFNCRDVYFTETEEESLIKEVSEGEIVENDVNDSDLEESGEDIHIG